MRILLVRHAMPEAAPEQDPAHWPLSSTGQAAARGLRGQLPADAFWVASEEQKAFETLALARPPADRPIARDPRLNEVGRDCEPFDDKVQARRMAWVEGRLDHRHAGWEAPGEAGRRLDAALRSYGYGTVVVGSHGMVITAWLIHAGHLAGGRAAGRFWEALPMPAVTRVEAR